jgi:hypothetical protein
MRQQKAIKKLPSVITLLSLSDRVKILQQNLYTPTIDNGEKDFIKKKN